MEHVMKTKQLEVHPEKSCYLLMGQGESLDGIKSDIEAHPLIYDSFKLKNNNEAKHLGDYINEGGNEASIMATIAHRRGQVKRCIFEVGAVLNDIRMQTIGGITSGLVIWNMAIIPYLLNNSEVWVDSDKTCIDELEKLQTLFLSVLLAVPVSCARPALAWDTQTLSMENRVAQRKLNFVCHVKRLGEDSLAKQVYQEQIKHEWPGWTLKSRSYAKLCI